MKKEFTLERTYSVDIEIEILINDDGEFFAEVTRNVSEGLLNEDESFCIWIDEDGNIQTEENECEEEYDAIIDTFREYVIANGVKYSRKCDKCGCGMNEGYVVYNGEEHYCSEECLNKVYTAEQWTKMYEESEEEGGSDNYWTEWYQDDDFEYVLFNNQLIETN